MLRGLGLGRLCRDHGLEGDKLGAVGVDVRGRDAERRAALDLNLCGWKVGTASLAAEEREREERTLRNANRKNARKVC